MNDRDHEVQGILFSCLMNPWYAKYIHPPLPAGVVQRFSMGYLRQCIVEGRASGRWGHSNYDAAHDVATWFAQQWSDDRESSRGTVIADIKEMLAAVYRSGDAATKRCVVDGALEHMFQVEGVPEFFASWQMDPILSQPYEEAAEWSRSQPP
ncbi:MAG TPA: hypothetical protein VGH20_11420 [Myxococcales bacterium]